jgi:hypothetical protein
MASLEYDFDQAWLDELQHLVRKRISFCIRKRGISMVAA